VNLNYTAYVLHFIRIEIFNLAAAQNVDGTLRLTLVTDGPVSIVIQSFSVLIYLKHRYKFYVECIYVDDYRYGLGVINSSKIY